MDRVALEFLAYCFLKGENKRLETPRLIKGGVADAGRAVGRAIR